MKHVMYEPGQLIVVGDYQYEVQGVFLGAVGQTGMVGLKSVNENPGTAYGATATEMLVPARLMDAALAGGARLYTPVR